MALADTTSALCVHFRSFLLITPRRDKERYCLEPPILAALLCSEIMEEKSLRERNREAKENLLN
jgi:hypothetical protein